MGIFLAVLAWILLFALLMVGFLGPLLYFIENNDHSIKTKVITYIVGILVAAGAITVMVSMVNVNNSYHCNTGTVYQESSHYNPSTKQSETDWWCAAK